MTAKVEAAAEVLPGRGLGVIKSVDGRERGFLFVVDVHNVEHFAHKSAFTDPRFFQVARVGDAVSFRSSTTTKGRRAHDIQEANDAEQAVIAETEESRGNLEQWRRPKDVPMLPSEVIQHNREGKRAATTSALSEEHLRRKRLEAAQEEEPDGNV